MGEKGGVRDSFVWGGLNSLHEVEVLTRGAPLMTRGGTEGWRAPTTP